MTSIVADEESSSTGPPVTESFAAKTDPEVLLAVKEKYKGNALPPLLAAAFDGAVDDVKVLLEENEVDVNQFGGEYHDTPLSCACCGGHTKVIELLLEQPTLEVNARTVKDDTALGEAARRGRAGAVKLLLGNPGIDVNVDGNYSCTPLHYACCYGHPGVVAELLKHPAIDVNVRDMDGETPLHTAVAHTMIGKVKAPVREAIVELLLGHPGIQANMGTVGTGLSSLHYAAMNGHEGAVKKLLAHEPHIDANAVDNNGHTPMEHAAAQGLDGIVQMLKGHSNAEGEMAGRDGKEKDKGEGTGHGGVGGAAAASAMIDPEK